MKITFKQLKEIDNEVGRLFRETPTLVNTKFGYAYKRFFEKNVKNQFKDYNSELEEVRIDNALEDEKTKAILIDESNPRGYMYSKEGLKNIAKAENKLVEEWDKKECEIEPYIVALENLPELNEYQTELFTGIFIAGEVNKKEEVK